MTPPTAVITPETNESITSLTGIPAESKIVIKVQEEPDTSKLKYSTRFKKILFVFFFSLQDVEFCIVKEFLCFPRV